MRAPAGDEAGVGDFLIKNRTRKVELAVLVKPVPELLHPRAIAADEIEDVALEVRRPGNVHRRAGSLLRLSPGLVLPGAEKFLENVVLVGRQDQPLYRQAHAAGDVSGVEIAEVARRHCE